MHCYDLKRAAFPSSEEYNWEKKQYDDAHRITQTLKDPHLKHAFPSDQFR